MRAGFLVEPGAVTRGLARDDRLLAITDPGLAAVTVDAREHGPGVRLFDAPGDVCRGVADAAALAVEHHLALTPGDAEEREEDSERALQPCTTTSRSARVASLPNRSSMGRPSLGAAC